MWGTPVLTLDMAYDSNNGGITTKSDAGTMIYNYSGKPYPLALSVPRPDLYLRMLNQISVHHLNV
jgi:hypothetical protein